MVALQAKGGRPSPSGKTSLGIINAAAMRDAVSEFNEMGRAAFLRAYGFRRSSKYDVRYPNRLYDAKALVAGAYYRASGRRLENSDFTGGVQTAAVYRRIAEEDHEFAEPFGDTFGELGNLRNEYDRIPRHWDDLRQLGFSRWVPFTKASELKTGWLPVVYVLATAEAEPRDMELVDRRWSISARP